MKISTPIVAVAIAIVFATASTATAGDAFSFGQNDYGQLGLNSTDPYPTLVASPIVTTNLGGRKLTQVSAGSQHSLLLTDNGTVFSCGNNGSGQTGLATTTGTVIVATPIITTNLGGRKITQVAAGQLHSLLLANDGSVFSFGYNDAGRLGLGTTDPFVVDTATPINTTNLGSRKITQVAAGGGQSLLLADDGSVFSFGFNGNGRTGLGTTSGVTTVATPINTTNLGGRKITQVAAGFDHSLLLADDGTVFSFGNNFWGATGLGGPGPIISNTTVATPIVTTNLGGRKITQVAAGGSFSLLLADDGSVFSFGQDGGFGQLGLGSGGAVLSTVATPIVTTNLAARKITQIAAGTDHSLILAEDGSVFGFGVNAEQQLGIIGASSRFVATPIDTTNLGGLTVTQIDAGDKHSLLIAEMPGDFNHDNTVDAADYVVWRKNPGGIYTPNDYNTWRSQFGATLGPDSGAGYPLGDSATPLSAAVPEPTTLVLLIFAAAGWCFRRSRAE